MRQRESDCHLIIIVWQKKKSPQSSTVFHLHLNDVAASSPRKVHHLILYNLFRGMNKQMFSYKIIAELNLYSSCHPCF